MGHDHINHVRDHSRTKGRARFVLLAIATRVDTNGFCFPSYQCLARDTGLSISTVRRAIKEIPLDELEIVEQGGSLKNGKRRSTTYRLVISDKGRCGKAAANARRFNYHDPSQSDGSTIVKVTDDHGQNGRHDHSQIDHLTEKAKQSKEQRRLTDGVATQSGNWPPWASVTPKRSASVLLHKEKARKQPDTELPWELSDGEVEDLQERFHRLGDIRRFIREAAEKCAEIYPNGGPMRWKFFKEYLAKLESDLDPPGLEEGRRLKMEEAKSSFALINGLTQKVLPHVQPDYDSDRNILVPAPPRPPAIVHQDPTEAEPQDPQAHLETWKSRCPALTGEFERIHGKLRLEQGDWDAKQAKRFNRLCGEAYDHYLRRPRAA